MPIKLTFYSLSSKILISEELNLPRYAWFSFISGSPVKANTLPAAIIGGGVGAGMGAVVLLIMIVIIIVIICVSTKGRKRNKKSKQLQSFSNARAQA